MRQKIHFYNSKHEINQKKFRKIKCSFFFNKNNKNVSLLIPLIINHFDTIQITICLWQWKSVNEKRQGNLPFNSYKLKRWAKTCLKKRQSPIFKQSRQVFYIWSSGTVRVGENFRLFSGFFNEIRFSGFFNEVRVFRFF